MTVRSIYPWRQATIARKHCLLCISGLRRYISVNSRWPLIDLLLREVRQYSLFCGHPDACQAGFTHTGRKRFPHIWQYLRVPLPHILHCIVPTNESSAVRSPCCTTDESRRFHIRLLDDLRAETKTGAAGGRCLASGACWPPRQPINSSRLFVQVPSSLYPPLASPHQSSLLRCVPLPPFLPCLSFPRRSRWRPRAS